MYFFIASRVFVCCFKAKEELHSELVALRIEYNNEQQSSTQAAATLAATNAARQTEMEMQIEKMQKEIGKSDLRPYEFSSLFCSTFFL
jgi:hypothetical protein